MAAQTEAQKRAQQRYREARATIQIVTTPDRRDQIKAHSETRGESVNAFINRAVDEAMERDNAAQSAK